MPGIYINDSSVGPSLGSAIANIANNFNPKTQAEAQMLRLQMEGQGWQNREASDKVLTMERAARSVGGMLSQFKALPAVPNSSKPGGITSMSSPGDNTTTRTMDPGAEGRGVIGTDAVSPYEAYVQAEVAAGRLSPEALKTAVDLGQQATMGPGHTWADQGAVSRAQQEGQNAAATELWKNKNQLPITKQALTDAAQVELQKAKDTLPITKQALQDASGVRLGEASQMVPIDVNKAAQLAGVEIEKARHSPLTQAPGQTWFSDPAAAEAAAAGGKPAAGLTSGDVYTQSAREAQGPADVKTFSDMDQGAAAGHQGLQRLAKIQDLYNNLIQNSDASGKISTAAQEYLRQQTGLTFTDKAAAAAEIAKQINEIMSSLRGPMGIQRLAGPEISLLQQTLPNAVMDPRTFNDIINSMKVGLTQQVGAGEIARQYLANPSPGAAAMARNMIDKTYAQDPFEQLRGTHPTLFNAAPGQGAGEGFKQPGALRPATGAELNQARQLIAGGANRAEVEAHMKLKGVSPEGL